MKKKINISDKTLSFINRQKIKPIPKWEFVIKNWGIWLGFGICLLLLILGVSVSWFGLVDNIITPYFWLFIVGIFLGLSYLLFERTKKAYRVQKWHVIVFIVVIGLATGGYLFKIGVGNNIDKTLESRVSFYRQVVPMKIAVWSNPESGYLSGKITKIIDKNSFEIKDFNEKIWLIDSQNALVRGRVEIEVGEEIKLIGTQVGTNTFKTEEVRPWNGMGQNMMKEND